MKWLWSVSRGVLWTAALLLSLGSAVGAVLAWGGAVSDRLDVLTHFAPFYCAAALFSLPLILIAGHSRGLLMLSAIAMTASGALMAPDLMRRNDATASTTPVAAAAPLKVIQFNLWGRNTDPEGTTRWILAQNADVLVFEEAFGATDPIIAALRARYPYATTCADPWPCSTMIMTREKPLDGGGFEKPDSPAHVPGAWVTLATAAGPITVVGVHYTWPVPAGPQQAQSRRLTIGIAPFDKHRLIIAGDFNSTPWSFSMRRQDRRFGIERRSHGIFSWPASYFTRWKIQSPFPFFAIDHVYAGADFVNAKVVRGPRLGSDHFPLVATFWIRAQAPPPTPPSEP